MQQSSQNGGILSKLALHFPRVFSFWGRRGQQEISSEKEDAVSSDEMKSSLNVHEGANRIAPSVVDDRFDKYYAEMEPAVSNNKLSPSRFSFYLTNIIILHASSPPFPFFDQIFSSFFTFFLILPFEL